jgi:hypothetical protein
LSRYPNPADRQRTRNTVCQKSEEDSAIALLRDAAIQMTLRPYAIVPQTEMLTKSIQQLGQRGGSGFWYDTEK